jgi:putative membrane protein
MRTLENSSFSQLTPSFTNWLLSGFLMGLGAVVPGMSPSNFLIYFGLYDKMAAGISHLDFGVIIPILIGGVLCVLIFARLISLLFKKHYAVMCHLILGIVVGSTIAIIPRGVTGAGVIAMCALLFVVGAVISYLLAKLDEKYAREPAF